MDEATMYRLLMSYLEQLPGALAEKQCTDGTARRACIYNPHSLRATTATTLLDAGEDIVKVKDLLGHAHVTTTQVYDKRRRRTKDSASHAVPI
jgi:site-specific recombinase XerD